MPSVLEAVALNLMALAFTKELVYGQETYTRCAEKIDEKYTIVVGGFNSTDLDVLSYASIHDSYGIACALRKF